MGDVLTVRVGIASFWWIIISIASTIVLLQIIINGWARIKPVAWGIVSIYTIPASALIIIITICWMVKQIVWGTVDSMFFTIASISVSVFIRVINKWLDRRVEDLGVAVAKLHRMQTALCHLDQIPFAKQCNRWLNSVDNLQTKEKDIKVRYDGCGLNYIKRFVVSWQADQILNTANDLLRLGDNLLHPKDQLRGTTNFYKKVVIDFIEDMGDHSGLLGIWGMGGVGKTSLLKLMVGDSRSEYDNDSFEVLFVRAGIGCTVGQVQEAIAISMGLSLERNETSQAKIINDHLKDTSFLLLLDDLWGYLDLKAVGIPLPLGTVLLSLQGGVVQQKRRKVVLTSRNMELCGNMGCRHDNTIQMECYNEEDAWKLYRRGWPVAINRTDAVDKSSEILPAQTSSSLSHSRQLVTMQPHTMGDVLPKRPQDDLLAGMMGAYEKVHYFIEAEGAQSILLGVWGTRGVGKTALLRFVRDSYTGNSCFDDIIFVGAGTGSVVNNVQHAIAINLGLDLALMSSLDELSRATHIYNYLEHKSFLLLLDDIREPLNWWAVGLPILSHRRQKIIFAARTWATCALMGCSPSNTIKMLCLGNGDAWNLFKCKVGLGIIDDHPQVHHLAKQMVSRCGGLPLALCALGRAMSNKEDPREWRSAHSQLMAMRLEPCEIDDKAVASILNPKTTVGQKEATPPTTRGRIFDQPNRPSPYRGTIQVTSRASASDVY